jgi:hypothetical protein
MESVAHDINLLSTERLWPQKDSREPATYAWLNVVFVGLNLQISDGQLGTHIFIKIATAKKILRYTRRLETRE